MITTTFESHAFFTTLRITIPSHDGVSNSIGTGFLVSVPLRQPNLTGIFLVSNRHVFGDPKGTVILNLHRHDASTGGPALGETIQVRISDFSRHYYAHSDPQIDLACINVSGYVGQDKNVFHKQLGADFIKLDELNRVHAGQSVMFVGYPDNRFDAKHNLPILRMGHLATLPSVDFNGLKQIVIDAQVFPGSSGSPVFVVLDGRYLLLGVVSQTMIKHATLQTIPTEHSRVVQQVIGLGIVLKASLVQELILKAANELSDRIDARSTISTKSSETIDTTSR